jgi:RNA-directed DNA polymerase
MSVIAQLATKLDKTPDEVYRFLINAPKKYRVYSIPKRKHGHRIIAQPTKELKHYQRTFLAMFDFKTHPNSTAYRKGMSIKDNALFHNEQRYLLKMDLENFFNSITPEVLWTSWQKFAKLPENHEKQWIEKLLFWDKSKVSKQADLVLSVGAPSSPMLSNFCLFELDELLTLYCNEKGICYSRYADDLTFSTNEKEILFELPAIVQARLTSCFGQKLLINHRKTVFSSKAHNRHVTGVTISNEGKLSLGRERKRYIKHLVHQFTHDKLAFDDIRHLQGLLSFARHIEVAFIVSLKAKYCETVIKQIFEVKNDQSK